MQDLLIPKDIITVPVYPLKDGKGKVQLLKYDYQPELEVVNDAKASFERQSTSMGKKELSLLKYLLTSKPIHSSPLRGVSFKFRVKCPLYLARQWWKHVIASNFKDEQLGWNEKSFRYSEIDDDADYYIPELFLYQSDNNKQGSGTAMRPEVQEEFRRRWIENANEAYELYRFYINEGVARETARGVLPPCFYTTFVWTTSLQSLLHFLTLRREATAQGEIQRYGNALTWLVKPLIPNILTIMDLDISVEDL